MIDSSQASAVARLAAEGYSQRQIADKLQLCRSTIQRYIADPTRGMQLDKLKRPKAFKLDAGDPAKILNLIQQAKGNCSIITRRLNNTPEKYGLPADFRVSQRSVLRYATKRFPGEFARSCQPVSMPFHCEPGQQLQIDFVKAKFLFYSEDGHSFEEDVFLFEAVYAWSRKSFIRACPDMTQASWLTSIAGCLLENGVPRQILCDNDRGLVLEHNWRNSTVRFNPAFEWLCKPLGIMPRAARPARPQTKGRCERFGGYIRTNALIDAAIDRKLHNRADLQAVLDEWIRNTADQRRIRIGDEEATVAEFYKKEKSFLLFPDALGPSLSVMSWMTQATPNAGVYIYGTRTQLPIKMAGLYVTVTMRANGQYAITASDGKVIKEGSIPPENMNQFKRDDAPEEAPSASPASATNGIPEEFKDLAEIFGESNG